MIDVEERVGRRIRLIRRAREFTQEVVAGEMVRAGHLTWVRQTVSLVETAGRNVSVGELVDMAAILGVIPSELYQVDPFVDVPRRFFVDHYGDPAEWLASLNA